MNDEDWQPTMNLRVRTSWVEKDYLEQLWERRIVDQYGAWVDQEWRRVQIVTE